MMKVQAPAVPAPVAGKEESKATPAPAAAVAAAAAAAAAAPTAASTKRLHARFVCHVPPTTVQAARMEITPNTPFVKTWRLRNEGEAQWPEGCRLVHVGAFAMHGPTEGVPVAAAKVNEDVDISVALVSPPETGRFVSYWRLITPQGVRFGHRVWADVVVKPFQQQEPARAVAPVAPVAEAEQQQAVTAAATATTTTTTATAPVPSAKESEGDDATATAAATAAATAVVDEDAALLTALQQSMDEAAAVAAPASAAASAAADGAGTGSEEEAATSSAAAADAGEAQAATATVATPVAAPVAEEPVAAVVEDEPASPQEAGLVAMGFPLDNCRAALVASNGDMAAAAMILLNGGSQ